MNTEQYKRVFELMNPQVKYEEQLAKARKAQERQMAKQKLRFSDPQFLKKQQEKKFEAQQRAFIKQQEKLSSQAYRDSQLVKIRASAEKARKKKLEQFETSRGEEGKVVEFKPRKAVKQMGLKGKGKTQHERLVQNKLASLGCICCRNKSWDLDSEFTIVNYVSIHHCFGRSKRNNQFCEYLVLPLCEYHHQSFPPVELNPPKDLLPLHGSGKKAWEAINGKQTDLIIQCYALIDEPTPWLN